MDLSNFRMSFTGSVHSMRGPVRVAILVAGFAVSICRGSLSDQELIELSKDSSAIRAGKETYQNVCFSCHGQSLEGGTGFNLRDGEWVHGSSPTQILASTAKGFPEKGMVAFGSVYDEKTLENMVAYILSQQIGFRGLSYQIFHSAATNVPLERLTQSRPTKSGVLPRNFADEKLTDGDDYAMVFQGTLIVPEEGRHFIKVSKGRQDEVKVEVDGKESRPIDIGNREFQYAVKNGRQQVRMSYLKRDANPRFEVYLQGDTLYEPLSVSARNRMLQTNYFVKADDRPIVIRKKIEHLPPKSIGVGYPGSLNYGFSPVTNSIVGLWDGDFLNVGPNIDGRGKNPSRILGEWLFYESPGIQVLVEGEPFEGDFVKYTVGDSPRFEYADEKRRVRVSASPNGLRSIRFHFELEGFGRKRITLGLPEKSLNVESKDGAVLVGRFIVDKAKRSQFSITVTK